MLTSSLVKYRKKIEKRTHTVNEHVSSPLMLLGIVVVVVGPKLVVVIVLSGDCGVDVIVLDLVVAVVKGDVGW